MKTLISCTCINLRRIITNSPNSIKTAVILFLLLFTQQSLAVAPTSGITYTGRILDSNDVPVVSSQVIFTITVYDPDQKCWLYTEQRKVDLSNSAGTFSFEIGSNDSTTLYGTPSFNNPLAGGPKSLADVFNNNKSFTGLDPSPNCVSTAYNPGTSTDPNEGRVLGIYFRIGATGADQALPPLRVTPVPMALQAFDSSKVNGYDQNHLLRIDPTIVSPVNSDLNATKLAEFFRLVNNPSAAYLPVTGDVTVVSGNNKVTTILGQALPGGAPTNGQALVSNGTSWVLQSLGSGSVTSVSATAPLTVTGTAAAPIINIPAANTTTNGYLTSADWNIFNSKIGSSLTSGSIWVGNGSNVATAVAMSGDATMANTGAVTLKNTGTAGTYYKVTTDAQGRVTSGSNLASGDITTALGYTPVNKAGDTMGGALNMGGFDISNTGNISMAASKTFGLSSNAADPVIPATGQVWYNSTSNVIKYYDGTAVKALGVAGAGITSLNGLTSGTQTFAIGTSGTAPAFTTAPSTHTLNIPMASTAAVTAGLISKTDYDSFNTKLGAVTNTATLSPTKIWIGDVGSKAQEFALSGDATMSSGGVVTVDKTQAAAASKILQLTAGSVAVTKGEDIGGAGTGVASIRYPNTATNTTLTLPPTAGSASQFLQTDGAGNLSWAAPAASLPGLNNGLMWLGNASNVATAVSMSGDATISNAGVVTANKTTTGQSNKLLSLDGTGVATAAGLALTNTGTVTLSAQAASSTYGLKWPAAAPSAGQSLQSDASGNMSWVAGLTSTTGWAKNGNSFGAKSTIGNIDNFDLGFITNNTERMTILSSGNVGIGTTTPQQKLHIAESVAGVTYSLKLDNYGINGGTGILFSVDGDGGGNPAPNRGKGALVYQTSGTWNTGDFHFLQNSALDSSTPTLSNSVMTIKNNGNVGIGTTAPASILDINGAITQRGMVAPALSPATQGRIYFDSTSNTFKASQNGGAYSDLVTSASVATGYVAKAGDTMTGPLVNNSSSASTALAVTQAGAGYAATFMGGNVGIGITTPNSPFVVYDTANNGSSGVTANFTNYYTSGIATPSMVGAQGLAQNGGIATVTTAYGLSGVIINAASGNITTAVGLNGSVQTVGVGTVTNAYGLKSSITQPIGTITNAYGVYTGTIQGTNKWSVYASDSTAPSYFAGNVGIGTTSPTTGTRLDITGTGVAASSMIIPRDTVANRPTVGVNGMIRYASDTNKFEAYENGAWTNMVSSTNGTVTSIVAGAGLTGGTITSTGTIAVDSTQAGVASKILQLTAASVAVTKGVDIGGAGAGVASLRYPSTVTNTTLTLPSTAGSASQFLQTDGAGNLSWASGNSGTVTSVSGTAPISVATGTTTPVVSITAGTSTGQALRWNGTAWASGFIAMTDLRSNVTGASMFASSCGANQTLTYNSVGDIMSCANISIDAATQLTGILPVANGGTGTATGSITGTGALAFAAGGVNNDVTLTPAGTGKTVISSAVVQLAGNSGVITSGVTSCAGLTGSITRDSNGDLYICK